MEGKKSEKEEGKSIESSGKFEDKDDKNKRNTKIVFLGVIILFGSLLLISWIAHLKTTVPYGELTFNKVRIGSVEFYHTVTPLYHPVTGKHISDFNTYLRNDPKTLENIALPASLGFKSTVMFSGDDALFCKENTIAIANVVQVLHGFSLKTVANNTMTCADAQKQGATWIRFQNASENKIIRVDDCYTLFIADCATLNVTERFIVGILAEADNSYDTLINN